MKQLTFAATALAVMGTTGLPAAALYSVTDLHFGPYYIATSLNDYGAIAGVYSPGSLPGSRAFTYSNGQLLLLGTLGGDYSGARAINNAGQVTGDSNVATGTVMPADAFLYSNGQMFDLGLGRSVGLSINNAGQIAGEFLQPEGYHAFLYTGAQTIDLGTLGGSESVAFGVNNLSQVTGNADLASGAFHAFLYKSGQMTDLGTLGGSTSSGAAINDNGQITGDSTTTSGADHAFPYSNGLMLDLGTLGTIYTSSAGNSINNLGQVVGSSSYFVPNEEAFVSAAFLYSNGTMQNLNSLIDPTLGITLNDAVSTIMTRYLLPVRAQTPPMRRSY
jgi:probable HAF family extracellular repeat protein